jgi:hypothetical protein
LIHPHPHFLHDEIDLDGSRLSAERALKLVEVGADAGDERDVDDVAAIRSAITTPKPRMIRPLTDESMKTC